MQATLSSTRCFVAGKATRAARSSAVKPVCVATAGPKAPQGEMVDDMGFKLMRAGVKVRGACERLTDRHWAARGPWDAAGAPSPDACRPHRCAPLQVAAKETLLTPR